MGHHLPVHGATTLNLFLDSFVFFFGPQPRNGDKLCPLGNSKISHELFTVNRGTIRCLTVNEFHASRIVRVISSTFNLLLKCFPVEKT